MQIFSKSIEMYYESYGNLKISNKVFVGAAIVVSLWRHFLLIQYA